MKFDYYIKEDMKPTRCCKCGKELGHYSHGWYMPSTNTVTCKECHDKSQAVVKLVSCPKCGCETYSFDILKIIETEKDYTIYFTCNNCGNELYSVIRKEPNRDSN